MSRRHRSTCDRQLLNIAVGQTGHGLTEQIQLADVVIAPRRINHEALLSALQPLTRPDLVLCYQYSHSNMMLLSWILIAVL